MKNLSTKTVVFSSLILFTIAGSIYSLAAPKVYSSKSHIALFRLKVENPDYNSEESRNRWIWIRDGLNLRSAVITDSVIEKIADTNETAKVLSVKFPNKHLFYEYMKKLIDVQFTGADENNFLIEVKAPSAKLALELNTAVFDRIKYLATTADQKNFEELVKEIKNKQKDLQDDKATYSFYEDKLRKMTFNHIVEQKQRETAFEIISNPTLNDHPIWPMHRLIIVMSALIGLIVGFACDFLLKNSQREK